MDEYTLTGDSARRISNVVRRVERMPLTPVDPGIDSYARPVRAFAICGEAIDAEAEQVIEVCDNAVYYGTLIYWNHEEQCWAAGDNCWLTELNGVTLTEDTRYAGDLVQSDYQAISDDTTSIRPLVMVELGFSPATGNGTGTCTNTETVTFNFTSCVDGVETTSTVTLTFPYPVTVCEET